MSTLNAPSRVDGQEIFKIYLHFVGSEFAALYLIKNGADVNLKTYEEKRTPLHVIALCPTTGGSREDEALYQITAALISRPDCQINSVDYQGSTALHLAVSNLSMSVFDALLMCDSLDLDIENANGLTPLAIYLLESPQSEQNSSVRVLDSDSMASRLIDKGCAIDTTCSVTGITYCNLIE